MKIALAQLEIGEDIESNFLRTIEVMEEASRNGARLITFPEVQFYPFFPQYPKKDVSRYAFSIEDEKVTRMQEKCRELNMVAVPNFYLEEDGNHYDASVVIDADGRLRGVSKMVHIVQIPLLYEQDYYTPSDSGFKAYETAFGKLGVVICFDRHYPESIRSCVLQGAELIIISTANFRGEPMEMFEWEMRTSSYENNVFIAMCNRVGIEGEMEFTGESLVVDPDGNVLAKADDRDQILYAEIDLGLIEKSRRERPFLKLRRPETYSWICDKNLFNQDI